MNKIRLNGLFKEKIFCGKNVFMAVSLFAALIMVSGYAGMETVKAETADTPDNIQIGSAYWLESRGNIVYTDGSHEASFHSEDIKQIALALQEVEEKADNQGIIDPDTGETYTATAENVLVGKTFFNANKEGGAGADIGVMADMANTSQASILTTNENGSIGEEGYSCTGNTSIPLTGYYNTDSTLTFDLTDNNKSCYNSGFADGYAQTFDNVSIEYIYHHHDAACTQTGTCTWLDRLGSVQYIGGDVGYKYHLTRNHSNTNCPSYPKQSWSATTSGDVNSKDGQTGSHVFTYYTCGYTDGEMIGATLSFK